ncbi:MAG: FISUMP domain-containing protein [Bacteroidales bacterium]|nr:FISUMP domain-containing protein [Bacteroidales bacterium]MDZ4203301.1 FISUMP domain-containing protein [Bacteroidales bacterium]
MRKFTFLALLTFAIAALRAQDYQISFTGSGQSTTVDSIRVQNLTQGTSLTLNGSDVLHLVGVVGIERLTESRNHSLRIYPNPTTSSSNIEFEVSEAGLVTIDLFDFTGKKVGSTQNNLHIGTQTFNVSGLNVGIYTVRIKSANFIYSGKIISIGSATGAANITYINSTLKADETSKLQSSSSLVQMQYNIGDRLLFKGISGIYSTIIIDIPTGHKTITFNFVAATDADGNNYATVTIGSQTWLAENLKTTKYRNGEDIVYPGTDNTTWQNNTTGAYAWWNHNISWKDIYGALYNWYVISSANGLCPPGWHIPNNTEWVQLTNFAGGEYVAGGKLKSPRTAPASHPRWKDPNAGATDQYGFSAFPGGHRGDIGLLYGVDGSGYWWSSTEQSSTIAFYRYMIYDGGNIYGGNFNKSFGCSVRCLKD